MTRFRPRSARLATVLTALVAAAALAVSSAPALAEDGVPPLTAPPAEGGATPPETDLPAPDPGSERAPVGDPILDGSTAAPQPESFGPAAAPGSAFPGAALRTNAITSGTVDEAGGRIYSASRTASPATLFTSAIGTGAVTQQQRIPVGTGSWDMEMSGTTLAIGTSAATNAKTTWLVGYDTGAGKFTKTVPLPGANIVMTVIEDTVLSTPGNGRYFWAGTYAATGARLFRVDLLAGTAKDYTPPTGWAGYRYVRALTADASGITIGLGNPAAVWRLTPKQQAPTRWAEASSAAEPHAIVYALATLPAAGNGQPDTVVIGTEGTATVSVVSAPAGGTNGGKNGSARRSLQLPESNTVDRIAVDRASRTAWFTTRPLGTLFSLALDDPAAQPVSVATPVPGSETRTLEVRNGLVHGLTGTSDYWTLDPSTGTVGTPIRMVGSAQEKVDFNPQGVVPFAGRVLVNGHWRYQVHGDPSTSSIDVPGEPKAQVVVGDTMYSAIYPSGSVYAIESDLSTHPVARIGNGQMRPGAIVYLPGRDRLAVATGPAYGKYGGGLSLVSRDGATPPQVFTRPVGDHIISALQPRGDDLLLGTQTLGEAMPELPGQRAQIRLWRPQGNATTGTTVWSRTVPFDAQRITGIELVEDETGSYVLAAAQGTLTGKGWLVVLDPANGSVLWSKATGTYVASLSQTQGVVTAQIGTRIVRIGSTRSDAAFANVSDPAPGYAASYSKLSQADGPLQLAYVSAGAQGVAGLAQQGAPRTPYRISGEDRYQTAAAVSRQTYQRASTVLLARGDDFADALSAGPLAAALDAPVLLVQGGKLTPETRAEISRLGARTAIVVGGTGVIPNSVAKTLPAGVSLDPKRLQGANRYETSVAIAERLQRELGGARIGVLATTGTSFADAVAAVPAAVSMKRAIVLVDRTPAARRAMTFVTGRPIEALGGPAASALDAARIRIDSRVVGEDRYDTAARIASRHFGATERAYVASGSSFPDGLTAGVLAAKQGAPLLLSMQRALPNATAGAIAADGAGSRRSYLVGGVGVLDPVLEGALAALPSR
ncbi:cell wall-binding repeat-containing protein [Leucobacter iarius]|uniref:Cell wall binding repeat protein n=1 Tax=Leucobacter iarius TaxID=333963 RepID=A0ABN2L9S1_9MICO